MDHRLTRLFFPIVIVIIISLACTSPLQPAATTTPEPSATPIPTDTATPDPTPTFTSTPDRAAEATAAAQVVIDQFRAEMGDHDISTDSGHLGWVQDMPIKLNLVGGDGLEYRTLAAGMEAGDFILKTDITWNNLGDAVINCGLVFRADSRFNDGERYEFWIRRFSGLPLWEIQFWDGMEYVATSGTHISDALNQANGATNQIIIVAEDNAFTIFINGILQMKVNDPNSLRSDGQFGVVGSRNTGNLSCEFENSIIWVTR